MKIVTDLKYKHGKKQNKNEIRKESHMPNELNRTSIYNGTDFF